MELSSYACLNAYEKLVFRMESPRVVIDNAVCSTTTVVKVDTAKKHGILLEAVQVLTDLNLSIKKAYISSDGRWFLNVYYVTDQHGRKLTDDKLISYIEQSLGNIYYGRTNRFNGLTAVELTGAHRFGLLSEVFALLADLQCSVVEAKMWTHNNRVASLIYVKDCNSGSSIEDDQKISLIDAQIRNVLEGDTRLSIYKAVTHTERRLHQMMLADRDYERRPLLECGKVYPVVMVQNWAERGYSVVNIQCKDRPKLAFDVLCTLTDMEYVIFHGTINTSADQAYLEFYIKHKDGTPIHSHSERQRVIQCIEAAIERRASEDVRLELYTNDRQGLLAEVTRAFRENGLNVTSAKISTVGNTVQNAFYVTDAIGNPADAKIIETVQKKIGLIRPQVNELPKRYRKRSKIEEAATAFCAAVMISLESLTKNLHDIGLIDS